jgi:hypothetical protein
MEKADAKNALLSVVSPVVLDLERQALEDI